MSNFFVKSSYSDKTTGTKQDGVTLEFGVNAFQTVEDAAAVAAATDVIVVLDSKAATGATAPCPVAFVYDSNDKDTKVNLTAKGALTVSAAGNIAQLGGAPDATTRNFGVSFDDYSTNVDGDTVYNTVLPALDADALTPVANLGPKDLTVDGGTIAAGRGGKVSQSWSEKITADSYVAKTSESFSAAGKLVAGAGANVAVDGYDNVNLSSGAIANVNGGTAKDDWSQNTKGGNTKVTRSASTTATGKLTAVDSTVSATGYANVDVKYGTVNNIAAGSTKNSVNYTANAEKETASVTEKNISKALGKATIKGSTAVGNVTAFKDVTISDIAGGIGNLSAGDTDFTRTENATPKKADKKEIRKNISSGKLVLDNIAGTGTVTQFETVTAENVALGGAISRANDTVTDETIADRVKNIDTRKVTATQKAGGSVKLYNVTGGQNVVGYAKVSVDGASAVNDIDNITVSKVAGTMTNGVLTAAEVKMASNGSVDIKNGTVVNGNVVGYKTVNISGSTTNVAGNIVAGDMTDDTTGKLTVVQAGSYDYKETSNVKVTNDQYDSISGTHATNTVFKTAGSVKVTDATVNGTIDEYKDVTLVNATVNGFNTLNGDWSNKRTVSYKTAKKVNADKSVWGQTTMTDDTTTTTSKGGKLTATGGSIAGTAIFGFGDVKLTNVNVTGTPTLTGTLTTKSVTKTVTVGVATDFDASTDTPTTTPISQQISVNNSSKSTGSLTVAAKAGAAPTFGAISDFNKVDISGVAITYPAPTYDAGTDTWTYGAAANAGILVTTGAITDSGNSSFVSNTKDIYDDNAAQGRDETSSEKRNYTATGSAKIGDQVAVGGIAGFKTVTISGSQDFDPATTDWETIVNGDIVAYDGTDALGTAWRAAIENSNESRTYKEKFAYDRANDVRGDMLSVSGKYSATSTLKAAGSFTADTVQINGDIIGFDKVSLDNVDVTATGTSSIINRGVDFNNRTNMTLSVKGNIVTLVEKQNNTENIGGSFKAVDSTIAKSIDNYLKVDLTDSTAVGFNFGRKRVYTRDAEYTFGSISGFDTAIGAGDIFDGAQGSIPNSGFKENIKDVWTAAGALTAKISAANARELFADATPGNENYNIGNIFGAKTVKLQGAAVTIDRVANIASIQTGAIAGGNTEQTTYRTNAVDTTVTKNTLAGSLDAEYAEIGGNISGFDKVTLEDVDFTAGATITGGNETITTDNNASTVIAQEIKAAGSFKGEDVDMGDIVDIMHFSKVELDGVSRVKTIDGANAIDANLSGGYDNDEKIAAGTLKMVDSDAATVQFFKSATVEESKIGTVDNVTNFTAADGFVDITTLYNGTVGADSITIAKGAVMAVAAFTNINNADKLAINGTLVLNGVANDDIALKAASGNGVIAGTFADISALKAGGLGLDKFKGSYLSLGTVTANFRGVEFEEADDDPRATQQLLEAGDTINGWLSTSNIVGGVETVDLIDHTDYIKISITTDDVTNGTNNLNIGTAGSGWNNAELMDAAGTVIANDDAVSAALAAGEYTLKLTRTAAGSAIYTVTLA